MDRTLGSDRVWTQTDLIFSTDSVWSIYKLQKSDLLFFCIHHHTFGHTIPDLPSLPTDCHITNNEPGAQMMCLCIVWAMRYVIVLFLFFWCFSNLVLHQILSFSTPPPAYTPSHVFNCYYALLSTHTSFHREHPFTNPFTCFQLPACVFHPSDAFFNRNTHCQPSRTAFTCSHAFPSICDHSQPFPSLMTCFSASPDSPLTVDCFQWRKHISNCSHPISGHTSHYQLF